MSDDVDKCVTKQEHVKLLSYKGAGQPAPEYKEDKVMGIVGTSRRRNITREEGDKEICVDTIKEVLKMNKRNLEKVRRDVNREMNPTGDIKYLKKLFEYI